jgi:hypothetical protein
MDRVGRDVPLPEGMQGLWKDIDDPTRKLVVQGGEVIYSGEAVNYDYKLIDQEDEAHTVSLKINDVEAEDEFQRANIT